MRAGFGTPYAVMYNNGSLQEKAMIKVIRCQASKVQDIQTAMVLECEVVGKYDGEGLPDVAQPPAKKAAPASAVRQAGVPPVSPSECGFVPVTSHPALHPCVPAADCAVLCCRVCSQ